MNRDVAATPTGFLGRAMERALGGEPSLRPRLPAMFEPAQARFEWKEPGDHVIEQSAIDETPMADPTDTALPDKSGELNVALRLAPIERRAMPESEPAHKSDDWPGRESTRVDAQPGVANPRVAEPRPVAPRVTGDAKPTPLIANVSSPAVGKPQSPLAPPEAPVVQDGTRVERVRERVHEITRLGPAVTVRPTGVVAVPSAPSHSSFVRGDHGETRREEKVVSVTIGRIEVRAPRDDTSRATKRATQGPQPMSLEEYLKRRDRSAP